MSRKVVFLICSIFIVSILTMIGVFMSARSPVLWEDDFENGLFRFNSTTHTVHEQVWFASEDLPANFNELDEILRHPTTVIVIGEVVGPSINRITFPRMSLQDVSVPVTFNHVITPVLVHDIIYIGSDITHDIRVGEVIDVREGYFFVTEETQEYVRGTPLGNIVAQFGTRPMESGNRYLIYAHNSWNRADNTYNYIDEVVLGAMNRIGIYRLAPFASLSDDSHPLPSWHRDAIARFGHLYHELPAVPLAPIIVPRTSSELNITIQGTPIATAIYDGDGNRLIQQGLGLYRETNARTLERVGERVSLSHALRRYRYILEPGEWVFKNLDFSTTALPASFQVLAFKGYEQVAMSYYADAPSSSNMELHVMPSGRATLVDREANIVIPPT